MLILHKRSGPRSVSDFLLSDVIDTVCVRCVDGRNTMCLDEHHSRWTDECYALCQNENNTMCLDERNIRHLNEKLH